jgi:phage FluMu protein Com
MIHTSIASSLQAPIKIKQIDIKCSPALGLRLLAKSAVQHSSQVLSTGYLTLVWLIIYYNSDQNLATLLYFLGSKWHMKVHCPDCKGVAELADDFSFVKCSNCSFEMTYGEYVKYIAYKDSRYSDILSDYK